MTVQSITIDGQPATFTFKQPTYPGNPNGPDDPEPARARRVELNPVSATNPNPPACAPQVGNTLAAQGAPVPGEQARDHARGADPGRRRLHGPLNYTGRPGVHVDGDGSTEGWFRNNTPASATAAS